MLTCPNLSALTQAHKEQFRKARPYPHVYFDDFLPQETAIGLAGSFPDSRHAGWLDSKDGVRTRKWVLPLNSFPESFRNVVDYFHSAPFLFFLERLSGVEGLQPDPSLWYAGLQRVDRGGFLRPHVDLNYHPTLRLYRCLSLNLYLSPNWKAEYGGGLRLYNKRNMDEFTQIDSLFNRCLLAEVSESNYHGYPDQLVSPPDVPRSSLTIFYYRRRLFSFKKALVWENIWR